MLDSFTPMDGVDTTRLSHAGAGFGFDTWHYCVSAASQSITNGGKPWMPRAVNVSFHKPVLRRDSIYGQVLPIEMRPPKVRSLLIAHRASGGDIVPIMSGSVILRQDADWQVADDVEYEIRAPHVPWMRAQFRDGLGHPPLPEATVQAKLFQAIDIAAGSEGMQRIGLQPTNGQAAPFALMTVTGGALTVFTPPPKFEIAKFIVHSRRERLKRASSIVPTVHRVEALSRKGEVQTVACAKLRMVVIDYETRQPRQLPPEV